jgi:uncharacterized protein (TIGR00369 family)
MSMTTAPSLPEGFVPHNRRSPFTDPWEPLFSRLRGGAIQLAVQLAEAHCNARGFVHGALIAALADNAMGLSAVTAAISQGLPVKSAVTVNLALDYLDVARTGELLELHPSVLRQGRTLSFVACQALCGERLIARANATFRML